MTTLDFELAVRLLNDRLTPLRNRKTDDIDFVVFRENTEGAYCGAGGFLKQGTADEIAEQTAAYMEYQSKSWMV